MTSSAAPTSDAAPRAVRRRPETVPLAALLIGVGGFLDAYTFVWHGVFANAQSGNIVLMMVYAAQNQWGEVGKRVPSIIAFVLGLLIAHLLSTHRARRLLRRPTRVVLAVEILVMAALGLAPLGTPTIVLTSVVSFIAAMQATTFRTVGSQSYNTTMATGNLRSMVSAAFTAAVDRDRAKWVEARQMFLLLVAFAVGALVGGLTTSWWHTRAGWIAAGALSVALVWLVLESRAAERRA